MYVIHEVEFFKLMLAQALSKLTTLSKELCSSMGMKLESYLIQER